MSKSKVTYHITRDCIHLSFDGQHLSVGRGDKRYLEVSELIKQERQDEIPELFKVAVKTLTEYVEGSGLTMVNGQLVDADGTTLPSVLSSRLRDLKDEGYSVNYLVKFWDNLRQNPSYRSREQLFSFLEKNGFTLTDDGHFVAYRGVSANFKDKHTGKYDNSPGSVCEMPRDQVDDDPTRTCSYGFHVAAIGYARDFAGGNGKLVSVKVNPRDVVAVPTDYNGQKMRVCRFEVIEEFAGDVDAVVYGRSVSQGNDDWDDLWFGDDEEGYTDDDVQLVLELANDYKRRYSDRMTLANRIEEDFEMGIQYTDDELTITDILEILNENESEWFTP